MKAYGIPPFLGVACGERGAAPAPMCASYCGAMKEGATGVADEVGASFSFVFQLVLYEKPRRGDQSERLLLSLS